jgi:hypothetical protein
VGQRLGAQLGGVRDLEGIRLRCYCDPDTGCWHWRGTNGKRHDRCASREPLVWLADQRRTATVCRAAWMLAGKPLKPGYVVWRRCRVSDCANPAHLMAGTKAQWGAWVARTGYLRGRIERTIINRRNILNAGRSTLTMELAQWIRESQQTGREIARVLGVGESPISRIRLGQTFRPTPAASVFDVGAMRRAL